MIVHDNYIMLKEETYFDTSFYEKRQTKLIFYTFYFFLYFFILFTSYIICDKYTLINYIKKSSY